MPLPLCAPNRRGLQRVVANGNQVKCGCGSHMKGNSMWFLAENCSEEAHYWPTTHHVYVSVANADNLE